ncbi:spinster family MFS transporter [Rhodohalobacter sp. 8-1]|uniref:spinster family MFS transporter n=1 Tax=Rhodohalobacter sp. 8-1 TaxID=3131972 RepID=UPI0030EDDE10
MKKIAAYSALILLTLIYLNSFFTRQIVAVLGVDIREAFQLGNLQIGLLYGTAFSIIYAVAGIPMGRLADRISRRWMIATGLLVWSLMTVLSGYATSFAFLVVARLLVGVSQSMLSPAVYSLLAEMFSVQKRATIFSFYASGIFLGIGFSFLAGGTIALQYSWQTAMIAVGLPGLILVPFVFWFVKEPDRTIIRHTHENDLFKDAVALLKKRTIQYHLIGFSLLACTGYTVLAFAGTVFNDVFNRADLTPQYGWFLFGVAGTVILAGKAADKLAERKPEYRFWIGIIAALGGLPFYAFGLFNSSAAWGFGLMGVGVMISSCYNGVAAALMQYLVPDQNRALAGGLYLFVISIAGFGLGPPVTGWLMDDVFTGLYGPSKAVMFVMLICSIGSTIAFLLAMRTYENDKLE